MGKVFDQMESEGLYEDLDRYNEFQSFLEELIKKGVTLSVTPEEACELYFID